jgi:hypothetical protein
MNTGKWRVNRPGLNMLCKRCKAEIPTRPKGRGRQRSAWCNDNCKNAFKLAAIGAGTKVLRRRKPFLDFETERLKPEFQRRVSEILSWALAQSPAV